MHALGLLFSGFSNWGSRQKKRLNYQVASIEKEVFLDSSSFSHIKFISMATLFLRATVVEYKSEWRSRVGPLEGLSKVCSLEPQSVLPF